MLEQLRHDLGFALRLWRRSPLQTVTILGTVALALGLATSTLCLMGATIWRPAPYPRPDDLESVAVRIATPGEAGKANLAVAEWRDLGRQSRTLSEVALYIPDGVSYTPGGGQPSRRLSALVVSPNLMHTLGVQPALGRAFREEEGVLGKDLRIILSHDLWRRLGADPALVGRTLLIDHEPHEVVGVMPEGFRFPALGSPEAWLPAAFVMERNKLRDHRYARAVARRHPGVSHQAAQAELTAIYESWRKAYPHFYTKPGALVAQPMSERVFAGLMPIVRALLGAALLLLLMACVNAASLLFARANERRRELAARAALGATRRRLLGQLLCESVLFGLVGGALGLLCALWLNDVLAAVGSALTRPLGPVLLDARSVGFALLLSIGAGLLFGLLPAVELSRGEIKDGLRESGRSLAGGRRSGRLRRALTGVQVAIALVLALSAVLQVRRLAEQVSTDVGFTRDGLLTMQAALYRPRTGSKEEMKRVGAELDALLARVRQVPGVEGVTVSCSPLFNDTDVPTTFAVEGRQFSTFARGAGKSFFQVLGLPFVAGRDFSPEEHRDDGPRALVVDEIFARHHLGGAKQALGKVLSFPEYASLMKPVRVVGVVRGVQIHAETGELRGTAFMPFGQWPSETATVTLRTRGEPLALAGSVVAAAGGPSAPAIFDVRTMEDRFTADLGCHRLFAWLTLLLAGLALLFAVLGVYSVMSLSVTQSAREIGLRIALGAVPRVVAGLLIRKGVLLVAWGAVVGAPVAIAIAVLRGAALGASALWLVPVLALFLCLAVLATYLPARRAGRVDPATALRCE
jgi:putative ABC transport system permease protein